MPAGLMMNFPSPRRVFPHSMGIDLENEWGVCLSFIIAGLLKIQLELPDEQKCKLRIVSVFFLELKEKGNSPA